MQWKLITQPDGTSSSGIVEKPIQNDSRLRRATVCLVFAVSANLCNAELVYNISLASLTGHNTSASPNYSQGYFPKNFGTTSYVTKSQTITIDPAQMDRSMHPVSPGHVSAMDVHTLIPSRPDLRWFAHLMTWWSGPGGRPFDIGINMDTPDYTKALLTDLKNRGFDGVIVCWNGKDTRSDRIARNIQAYLQAHPISGFTFIILVDKGTVNGKKFPQQKLQDAVEYCKGQYFPDPNYEREEGKPILMFYGIRAVLDDEVMTAVKTATGGNMVWVSNSARDIAKTWLDQPYAWHDHFPNGVNPTDPYNLYWVRNFYNKVISNPQKKAFGAMASSFNATLTELKDGIPGRGWALGGYLPSGHGACLVKRAELINAIIPKNVTRMQWVTWNDWAEGTAVEPGIENDVTVTGRVEGSTLRWTYTSGTGDESTIDHYEIYASKDGINAADLGSVPVGTHSFNLGSVNGLSIGVPYLVTIVAVGKPCIRDHASKTVMYFPNVKP